MMTKASRILVLVAGLALGLVYVLPVWTIDLEAPQYPEGIGMVIQINTIEGQKPHDLDNINNLNHYIGMKRIEPESIPELDLMPWIVALLMLGAVTTAALGRKKVLYGWVFLFVGISLVGMADFWKWEYDYGHDLDQETAIIKIPGMSYQPPLIGSKQILNFTAHSWPGAGGWIAILAALTAVGVAGYEWRRGRGDTEDDGEPALPPLDDGDPVWLEPSGTATRGPAAHTGGRVGAVALAALLMGAAACADPQPRDLAYGTDACEHCLMGVSDDAHGAEAVTRTGKVHTFDSVECLVAWLQADPGAERLHSAWVTDFADGRELVRADEAAYLVSDFLASPMGLGITAFRRAQDRDGAVHTFGGTPMGWDEVQALVAESWPDGRPPMGAHGGHQTTMVPAGAGGAS